MIDITGKSPSLRKAIAVAVVRVSRQETISAVLENKVPKGNVFEVARTAGLFAAKRTSDMIPDCHPMPVEFTAIHFETAGLDITVTAEVHTVYKTGVEVEAMHAASVTALTIYDMLKPIDKVVTIEQIRLVEKTGGKSNFKIDAVKGLKAAVIVCSDSVAAGKKEDGAGKAIIAKLESCGVETAAYEVIADETEIIQKEAIEFSRKGFDFVLFTGGTGLSPRDITPEALLPVFDRRIPGIEEAIRSYGQQRMPYAMLSRSVAGMVGSTLIIALPGSTRGAAESMDAIFPQVLHLFMIIRGVPH